MNRFATVSVNMYSARPEKYISYIQQLPLRLVP